MICPGCSIAIEDHRLIKSSGKIFCPEDGCGAFIGEKMEKIDKSEDDQDLEILRK